MKLERYKDKKETRRKAILVGLTVVTLVSVAMMLYKTFAKFTTTTSFQIMSGKVVYKKKGTSVGGVVIPTVESGDGLFEVPHDVTEIDKGWNQTEYRFAGDSPDNTATFCGNSYANIIGLVNVKTTSGTIEQRIKIMCYITDYDVAERPWNTAGNNNWINSSTQTYFNTTFYNSLSADEQNMIDKDVVWNLGGWNSATMAAYEMYEKERGTTVISGRPTEWSKTNGGSTFNSIALPYPSDYGYSRNGCWNYNLDMVSSGYCSSDGWIRGRYYTWFLTPNSSESNQVYYEGVLGDLAATSTFTVTAPSSKRFYAFPTLYLKKNVVIESGNGTYDSPYTFKLT